MAQPGTIAKFTWIGVLVALVLACVLFAIILLARGGQENAQAIEAGTRVIISTSTGEIIARQSPEQAAPEEATSEEAADETTEASEQAETAPNAEEEQAASPAPEAPTEAAKTETAAEQPAAPTNATQTEASAAEAEKPAEKPAPEPAQVAAAPAQPEKPAEPVAATVPDKQEPAAPAAPTRPKIAFIIGNVGLSKSSTEQAFSLPREVALSFSPYAHSVQTRMQDAVQQGREIFINLPLEPSDYPYTDPGPYGLLIDTPDETNIKQLEKIMGLGVHYVGLMSVSGERFTEQGQKLKPILEAMTAKGLLFVYFPKPSNTIVPDVSKQVQARVVSIDSIIDEEISNEDIKRELQELEKAAREHGTALGVGRPYPITLRLIQEWLETLPEKGIDIAPVSSIVPAAQ